MSIEELPPMTRDEAERATERIRVALDRVSNAWATLGERIKEAYQRRADLALGYGSWAEYADAELKPTEGIAAEVRRQLVGMLSQAGMSTRAIAPTVGASVGTVHSDRASGVHRLNTSPESESTADDSVIDSETGEVHESPEAWFAAVRTERDTENAPREAPQTVTGLDGKTYTRPAPKPNSEASPTSKRRPLTDQFFDAAYDLNRRVESVHRLTEDDRFDTNKNKVAQKHLSDLIRSRDLLQQVINRLS